jgi:hypothetical protein
MSLPPDVQCVDAAQFLVWRPCGILDQRKVDKIIAFVTEQENRFGKSFNRFTDISRLDSVDLSFNYVFHVALIGGYRDEVGQSSNQLFSSLMRRSLDT